MIFLNDFFFVHESIFLKIRVPADLTINLEDPLHARNVMWILSLDKSFKLLRSEASPGGI